MNFRHFLQQQRIAPNPKVHSTAKSPPGESIKNTRPNFCPINSFGEGVREGKKWVMENIIEGRKGKNGLKAFYQKHLRA
jgi:hypothetical protein